MRVIAPAIRKAISVSIIRSHKSEHRNHGDVDEGEYGERVAERAMNDVPEMKNLLGSRQKYNTFGQCGLRPC